MIKIQSLLLDQEDYITQIIALLIEGFIYIPEHEKDVTTLREKIITSCDSDNISLIALDEDSKIVGWIAGFAHYEGNVWELHPLIVKPQHQHQGIGTQLVNRFEEHVQQRHGITIYLGADDRWQGTSLYGHDIYQDLWQRIQDIQNLNHHPFQFYQKLGYAITGVIPDANGMGKPDILMAKRIMPWKN